MSEFNEVDSDQLPNEDTLINNGAGDPLDEGYSPNDFPRAGLYSETAAAQEEGLSIDRELAAEEPEVWDEDQDADTLRTGRLVDDPAAASGRDNDVFAVDEGRDGGAASAEEAAVHVIDE
ncbi:DUF5709 domain-containing protein [Rarobacter incanus]|uniref:DUF5709 domain-containing protein n=1 Tax=Rarobacter incanus TaxID=153494 RepID=A0A542SR40_9MICO|nr:DUF5709 domain-containing protein [Rarobacter incanus]TQK77086.1 hypothetical protein FB389_1801 [Rarobacter incanus]